MAGLYYEEFEPGAVIEHPMRRTVTETDNILFCSIAMNVARIHLDYEYAKNTLFGKPLMNSTYILGLVSGMTVPETTQGTTVGNLGYDEVRFPKPVFIGDTIRAQTEVLSKRESKSHPNAGIVFFRHVGYNQSDEIVCECKRTGMMLKKSSLAQ